MIGHSVQLFTAIEQLLFESPLTTIILILSLGYLSLTGVGNICTTRKSAYRRSICASILALLVGTISCLAFDKSSMGFQFLYTTVILPEYNLEYNLTFTLGVDGISMIFLLLTLFIFPICILAANNTQPAHWWHDTRKQTPSFFRFLLFMELLLVVTFVTLDLLSFYVFFESLLLPMFLMIGMWGARARKIKAAYYFFLFTLFGSLIMLFGLLYLYLLVGSTNYFVILNTPLDIDQQRIIWLCFFMAFAVKMPLFPFHIWLPEAHVEAPTVGSMLLASLLLKLGGYGFLRFSLAMLYEGSVYYSPLISTLSLLGVVYGSLATIRQIDLKRVIAYSSVAHMNLVMLGLFSYTQQGIEGAIYLMVGHGVVSTALFFCVGVLYDRYHSRLIRYYGGLTTVMPLFSTAFFVFTLANMSFPGTSNFLGELLLFLGIFAKNSAVLLFAASSIVLSAVYSVWLFNRIAFGTLKTQYIKKFSDLTITEVVILITLILPMLLLGISSSFIIDFLHLPVKTLLITAFM